MARHGQAVREAVDNGFFGSLDDEEYTLLQKQHGDSFEGILMNAMEWLLAEGNIILKGQERPVSELLLGPGGLLLTPYQRHWIELLVSRPLGLYEVIEVVPGESMRLRDLVFYEHAPVLARGKTGSQQAVLFDIIAARILPVGYHFELSGAVYSIPRHHGLDLIAELRREMEGVEPGSSNAREILSVIVRDYCSGCLSALS